jgi:ABC-type sugar transport system ATPase subunit
MSVFANMAYGLKIAKVPQAEIKTRVDKAAAMLELGHLLDANPASSRAASASGWPWGAPLCVSHRYFCLMNR